MPKGRADITYNQKNQQFFPPPLGTWGSWLKKKKMAKNWLSQISQKKKLAKSKKKKTGKKLASQT